VRLRVVHTIDKTPCHQPFPVINEHSTDPLSLTARKLLNHVWTNHTYWRNQMSDEKVPEVESTELSNEDLGNVAAGVTAAAPKKIAVSAGVIAGGKLSGMTPQYPAISEQNPELASQLSDQQLDKVAGGANKTDEEETIRNAATVLPK
jgi:hypothetical protein